MKQRVIVAGIVLGILLIVGLLVPRIFSGGSTDRASVSPAGAAVPAAPMAEVAMPTAGSANAADTYREAVKLLERLQATPAEAAQLLRYEQDQFDDGAAAFFDRHSAIMGLMKLAATQPECVWGERTMEQLLPALNEARGLTDFLVAHAKYAAAQQRTDLAVDSLVATLALGRRIDNEPVLTTKLVEVGIEHKVINALAGFLPRLKPEELKALPGRLEALPPAKSGKAMLQAELRMSRKTMAEQQGAVLASAIGGSLAEFYEGIGDAFDESPEVFSKALAEQTEKHKFNQFVKIVAPSLGRAQVTSSTIRGKRAMLQTAIAVLTDGEAAVEQSKDPFGSGPFTYQKTNKGFRLISGWKYDNKPLTLEVGG